MLKEFKRQLPSGLNSSSLSWFGPSDLWSSTDWIAVEQEASCELWPSSVWMLTHSMLLLIWFHFICFSISVPGENRPNSLLSSASVSVPRPLLAHCHVFVRLLSGFLWSFWSFWITELLLVQPSLSLWALWRFYIWTCWQQPHGLMTLWLGMCCWASQQDGHQLETRALEAPEWQHSRCTESGVASPVHLISFHPAALSIFHFRLFETVLKRHQM